MHLPHAMENHTCAMPLHACVPILAIPRATGPLPLCYHPHHSSPPHPMSFLSEFRAFAMRGNVLDLAVGVIIGGAFGKIVTSLVNDVIMPVIGVLLQGINFSSLALTVGASKIAYGAFLQSVVDFLIVAFCIFVFIKQINRLQRKTPGTAQTNELPVETKLLMEIRDLLRKS